jgi:hypothetical protein
VLARLVLNLIQILLVPVDAAGPSRSRLMLRRARINLRARSRTQTRYSPDLD